VTKKKLPKDSDSDYEYILVRRKVSITPEYEIGVIVSWPTFEVKRVLKRRRSRKELDDQEGMGKIEKTSS